LIADFLAKVPAGVSNLRGDTAEVTSALPLTEAEQDQVRQALNASNITFRVDPTILGGLKVRVGDQVIDDSIASRMNAMRSSLN
jgi:F-type H+-transporting ATPase subunit b